jgi:hypothetical protein
VKSDAGRHLRRGSLSRRRDRGRRGQRRVVPRHLADEVARSLGRSGWRSRHSSARASRSRAPIAATDQALFRLGSKERAPRRGSPLGLSAWTHMSHSPVSPMLRRTGGARCDRLSLGE